MKQFPETVNIKINVNERKLELTKLSKNPTRSGMEYQTQIRIQAL